MDTIKQLLEIDIVTIIIGVFIILSACVSMFTIVSKFLDYIGRPLKWVKSKNKDHELLVKTMENLNSLQQKHEESVQRQEESVKQSIRHDELIQKDLSEFMDDIKTSISNTQSDLNKLAKSDAERAKQIQSLVVGTKESLADKINQKYKYYLSINGIPSDEIDEFANLFAAYKAVGGNHSGDAKYKYCIENLPIIPVETKLKCDYVD